MEKQQTTMVIDYSKWDNFDDSSSDEANSKTKSNPKLKIIKNEIQNSKTQLIIKLSKDLNIDLRDITPYLVTNGLKSNTNYHKNDEVNLNL